MAADQLDLKEDPSKKDTKKSLWFRAARLYESAAKDLTKAEQVYGWLVDLDPEDDIAVIALEEIRRQLGKHEELIEMLLARSERAESSTERARAMADIGRLYAHELDDRAQAAVAFTQALCEDPSSQEYASELERLATTDLTLWTDALTTVAEVVQSGEVSLEGRNALLLRLGSWYGSKLSRPDLALPCYQAVISTEPSSDAALEGMANIYRTAQQWPELGTVLLRRADVAPLPSRARDFRAKAAELLDTKLNEPLRAKDIYEKIVEEDPTHEAASEALSSIYERIGDHQGLVKILEKSADALRSEARARVLCQIAELFEGPLNDLSEAIKRYESALVADDRNLDALRGLDRIFNRNGRYKELLANLNLQLAIAATPRQKINLYERMAAIHDEEFLDHALAAEDYEGILKIDPAHENSLTALVRHYRALDRWEDVASLYEKHLKVTSDATRRVELLLARGRVLSEQVGSPERAMSAYEAVLEVQPDHGGALEALARLREKTGDGLAALGAIEALAAKATTPDAKAEQWMRAARLLEAKGDRDGAIERYKAALDADPKNVTATGALRAAYATRGDASSAVELIAREIDAAEGNLAKARLQGEMARLLRERLKDDTRAAEAARKAIDLDPTALDKVEACVVTAVSGNSITLDSVQFSHSAQSTMDFGLAILQELPIPANRSTVRLSRTPVVRIISGFGRYAVGRRSQQFGGPDLNTNLLGITAAFGGPPAWVPFPADQCDVSTQTGEVWIPPGLLLAHFSDVRLRYVAGWSQANLPGDIKQAVANIVRMAIDSPFGGNIKTMKAGDATLERFSASSLDDDTKALLQPYKALLMA